MVKVLTIGPTACLAMHGLFRPHLHFHKAVFTLPIPPPLPGQSTMAAHSVVDQSCIRDTLVLRGDWVLYLSVLASPVVLDAVLPSLWCQITRSIQRTMPCYHCTTCGNAFNLWLDLGCNATVLANDSNLEVTDKSEKKGGSWWYFLHWNNVGHSSLNISPARFRITDMTASACLLELARILTLELDTDDKHDPSCK